MAYKRRYNMIIFIIVLILSPFICAESVSSECNEIIAAFCAQRQAGMDSFPPGTTFSWEDPTKVIVFPQNNVKVNSDNTDNLDDFIPDNDEGIWRKPQSQNARKYLILSLKLIPPAIRAANNCEMIKNYIKECRKRAGTSNTIQITHVATTFWDLITCCGMPKPSEMTEPPTLTELRNLDNCTGKNKVKNRDVKEQYRENGWCN